MIAVHSLVKTDPPIDTLSLATKLPDDTVNYDHIVTNSINSINWLKI